MHPTTNNANQKGINKTEQEEQASPFEESSHLPANCVYLVILALLADDCTTPAGKFWPSDIAEAAANLEEA